MLQLPPILQNVGTFWKKNTGQLSVLPEDIVKAVEVIVSFPHIMPQTRAKAKSTVAIHILWNTRTLYSVLQIKNYSYRIRNGSYLPGQ